MFTFTTVCHKTSDTHHPLLLLTNREGHRYLIGKVGEGSQRALNDNKLRLAKLKAIFLTGTHTEWGQIGGLPGLFLTISDATKNSIDVYSNCSKVLNYIVATWRYFVFRKGVELKIKEVENSNIIADSNIIVNPVKIPSVHTNQETQVFPLQGLKKLVSLMFPLDTSKVNDSDPESYKSDPADNDVHSHVSIADFPVEQQNQDSLSYIIRFMPLRGKFDVVRAKQLNVKPGKNYALLTQGESVLNEDGETVTPDQVMGKPVHFNKVLVLDIPNVNYLEPTLTSEKWFAKNDGELGQEDVGLVYHLLGDDIPFDSPEYMAFINRFPADCTHIISHSSISNNTITFKTFCAELLKLRAIKKSHFNLPYAEPYNGMGHQYLHSMQQFIVSPSGVTYDDSLVYKSDWSQIYDEHVAPLKLPTPKSETIDDTPLPLGLVSPNLKDNVQVSTLGTGSALPSIYRNVLSNLIRIPFKTSSGKVEFKSIILDGGENTLGSLLRTFGHGEQYKEVLSELRLVYLSHLHADHHLGLVSVINKWMEVNKDNNHTLHLVVPWQYNHFVNEWYKLDTSPADLTRINYISCEDFVRGRVPEYQRISFDKFEEMYDQGLTEIDISKDTLKPIDHAAYEKLAQDLSIVDFQACRAIHCFWAYSVSITFQLDQHQTFKVSYSGDTRPNTKFVDIGYGSDLLIHESSLDNDLIEEAIAKKHTTTIEAVNVARYMNCSKLILTHFSARNSGSADYITTAAKFHKATDTLRRYVREYGASKHTNLFTLDNSKRPVKAFDDLEIVFAFDSLIVRLNDTHSQKENLELMNEISDMDQDPETLERKRRETERLMAKQEAKRTKRLASQRS